MILAFPDIEITLQISVPVRVRLDGGHHDVLGEIDRLVLLIVGRHPKDSGQQILGPGQLPQRDADLIPGVEFHVEAKLRLDGINAARQIFARILGFQDGRIFIKRTHQSAGAGSFATTTGLDGLRVTPAWRPPRNIDR